MTFRVKNRVQLKPVNVTVRLPGNISVTVTYTPLSYTFPVPLYFFYLV